MGSFYFSDRQKGNPRVRYREALAKQESLSFRNRHKTGAPKGVPVFYVYHRGKSDRESLGD